MEFKEMIQNDESLNRGVNNPRSRFFDSGMFGRMFPTLPPFAPDTNNVRNALLQLGSREGIMDAKDDPSIPNNPDNLDNTRILAGFTFFGQFIDHDITFDPTSSLERQNDPEAVKNFRTPVLELDNIYGRGPAVDPHLYDISSGGIKFLVDTVSAELNSFDVPRNSQNTACIGDPRNDENLIVSQLHLAFLKFHNKVVDHIKANTAPNKLFSEAQRLVRWHYQWIVLNEFLPHIVGQELVDDILENGRKFYDWKNEPYIPVEFAVAAYRFGHSQVRPRYKINAGFGAPIFSTDPGVEDLRGGKRAANRFVEWSNFFDFGFGTRQKGKKIDTKLSSPLFNLPFLTTNSALAQRNLLRELTFGLPSGQAVAKAMHITPLLESDFIDLKNLSNDPNVRLDLNTPLWFYILKEAEKTKTTILNNGTETKETGTRLGPVGGRIVAEVLIGLLQGDQLSYLNQNPDWVPEFGENGKFFMVDLLTMAGVRI